MKRIIAGVWQFVDENPYGVAFTVAGAALFLFVVALILLTRDNNACDLSYVSFECRRQVYQDCMKSEEFTHDECVLLAGL